MKTRISHKRDWMVVTPVRMGKRTKRCLAALARAQGVTLSTFLRQHCEALVARTEPPLAPPTEGVAGQ